MSEWWSTCFSSQAAFIYLFIYLFIYSFIFCSSIHRKSRSLLHGYMYPRIWNVGHVCCRSYEGAAGRFDFFSTFAVTRELICSEAAAVHAWLTCWLNLNAPHLHCVQIWRYTPTYLIHEHHMLMQILGIYQNTQCYQSVEYGTYLYYCM